MSNLVRISAKNFKAIREAHVEFPNGLAAIVGRNGVGKSAMIDVLVFLRGCFENPQNSFSERGENKVDVISNKTPALLAELTLTFELPELVRLQMFQNWSRIDNENTQKLIVSPLLRRITYRIEFNEGYANQSLVVGPLDDNDATRSILELITGVGSPTTFKWLNVKPQQTDNLYDFFKAEFGGSNVQIGFDSPWGFEAAVGSINIEKWILVLAKFVTKAMREVSLIQPSRRFTDSVDIRENTFTLTADFSNLVQVIETISSRRPEVLETIIKEFQLFLPHIESVKTRSLGNATKRTIAFYERTTNPLGKFFTMEQTSFGTRSILGFLTKLAIAEPDSIICIEEPELHLHPQAQVLLAKLFLKHAESKTLLITTHSAVLVAELPVDSIYLATKRERDLTTYHQMGESDTIRKQVIAELGIKPSHNFEANALVFVEGVFDIAVYATWAKQLGIVDVDFIDTEGWTNFRYYAAARLAQKKRLYTAVFGILDGDTLESRHSKPRKKAVEMFSKLGIADNVLTISQPHVEGLLLDTDAVVKMRAGLVKSDMDAFIAASAGTEPKRMLQLCFEQFQLGYYNQDSAKLLAQQFSTPPDEIRDFLLKIKAACENVG